MNGMFHKYFMEISFRPEEYHKSPELFVKILDFFTFLGWFKEKNGNYQFTETGLFFAKRASAYGVTVSYLPTFAKIEELMFGNPAVLRMQADGSDEIHVDREMNVWGSGGAHDTYFKVVDEILIQLFNFRLSSNPKEYSIWVAATARSCNIFLKSSTARRCAAKCSMSIRCSWWEPITTKPHSK
jgi:hypothetical protein